VKTIASERYAPTTEAAGYINLPLRDAVDFFREWRTTLYKRVRLREVREAFPEVLGHLAPSITGDSPREILIPHGKDWTAYFDCNALGTDASSPLGHASRTAKCQALAIRSSPQVKGVPGVRPQRWGVVQFEMFGPLKTDWLNQVRAISAGHNGSRWEFSEVGTVQDFEETDRYQARRMHDRFTPDMLERYCQALGVDVFNLDAYGPGATVIESSGHVMPQHLLGPELRHLEPFIETLPVEEPLTFTLAQAQKYYGIVPGEADDIPW
jgi:hypothetical protein